MNELQEALSACEERFRNLIVRNADAIVVVDDKGDVRFVNPVAEAFFGRSAGELVGSEFGLPVMAGETTEVDIVGSDGNPCVAEMRVVDTEWEGGAALLAVLRDVTDRKRAEEERVQLVREQVARADAEQALRERDEFLAVAAHELRTPLSTLSAAAQLLRRQLDRQPTLTPEQLHSAAVRLDEQSRRLARLVSRLLSLSDINAGTLEYSPERHDLRQLITAVVDEMQAATSSHTLETRGPSKLQAFVDPALFEQLLIHLIDNAIQYSPSGGKIEIEVAEDERTATVAVRDHGLGVAPERRPMLFDRFTRAHADDYVSGLGLGLYICRYIAELHRGQIGAEFPEDGGARFVVTLPISQ